MTAQDDIDALEQHLAERRPGCFGYLFIAAAAVASWVAFLTVVALSIRYVEWVALVGVVAALWAFW